MNDLEDSLNKRAEVNEKNGKKKKGGKRLKKSSLLLVTINFYSDVCAHLSDTRMAKEKRMKIKIRNEVCQLSVKFFENIRNGS